MQLFISYLLDLTFHEPRISLLNEMLVHNPEMFWSTDDDSFISMDDFVSELFVWDHLSDFSSLYMCLCLMYISSGVLKVWQGSHILFYA